MKRAAISPEAELLYETPLAPEEFERRLAAALAEDDELEAIADLCRWFSRRYRTAAERFAYNDRKYAEWTRPLDASALLATAPKPRE